jgi:hypothetical protein
MGEPFDPVGESVDWVADTGLFVACGRRGNDKYDALRRFARRHDITFVVPGRVYEELGGAPEDSTPGRAPIDEWIDDGWVTVADDPDYADGLVSGVMDDARRAIARSSNRDEDRIEKADTELAAVAVERLRSGDGRRVCVVTTDRDAGESVSSALGARGFGERVLVVDGFELLDDLGGSF